MKVASGSVGAKEVIHDVHPYGSLTVQQVIQKSSNIGAAKIANKLGGTRLDQYLREFGFGSKSGISLAGESSGLLRNLGKARSLIDRVTVAFGQGVSVTPAAVDHGPGRHGQRRGFDGTSHRQGDR